MALAIGGIEDEYPHPLMLDPAQLMPFLRVNKLAQRFAPEYAPYNHLACAIQAQPGACDAGVDSDFYMPGSMMTKIDTPPFYANFEGAEALSTAGGLQVDIHSRVLDGNFDPIPGLFAIGLTAGSMFQNTYPHSLNCLSHTRNCTFGYMVGKYLSGDES